MLWEELDWSDSNAHATYLTIARGFVVAPILAYFSEPLCSIVTSPFTALNLGFEVSREGEFSYFHW